jgi:hypothetical protein
MVLPRPNDRLRRTELRDGNSQRRAGNVGDVEIIAELNRCWIACVLAANAQTDVWAHGSGALTSHRNQLADALDVQRNEGVGL